MLFKYIFSIPVVINGEESIFIDDTLEFNEKDHIVINHTHRMLLGFQPRRIR